ncbi:MAG: hypothetical protein PHV68_07610 [Candidatus Gastranaerophilales bacterium]|nr:hypothetical protein [Candidatus Gastranaerophilales bacterium]
MFDFSKSKLKNSILLMAVGSFLTALIGNLMHYEINTSIIQFFIGSLLFLIIVNMIIYSKSSVSDALNYSLYTFSGFWFIKIFGNILGKLFFSSPVSIINTDLVTSIIAILVAISVFKYIIPPEIQSQEFIIQEEVINTPQNEPDTEIEIENTINNTKEQVYNEDIPLNIRSIDFINSKKRDEKGQLASIGKLLINKRDLENVIEANALMQHIETSSSVNLIPFGKSEVYQNLAEKIKSNPEINDFLIFDNGGFIKYSGRTEKYYQIQQVGAVFSNLFFIIKNYLSQIYEINNLELIFETSSEKLLLIENRDFYLISGNKNTSFVFYEHILENYFNDLSIRNPNNDVLNAVFDNTKAFLFHLGLEPIEKIIVFADDKQLLLKQYNNKKLVYFGENNINKIGYTNLSADIKNEIKQV